ncbi:LysR family transcriptional regulator [Clostridium tyrobutyricum]|uniref:Transcriptional regulator, LysR family n=1 Tax=Clostridium tyrobutyricum DIVETGP TaxID=1408889 RepID=W6N324_CLOTY|nr:LysR family transcriptional regulator [Clostridium tyrobutyricum]AND84940.1 transcriptional regulator, LysR family [Clostridium tyrobutyricum]ANP69509.1 transcriptional regulator [Clostridium tyrobutyricum]MBV4434840.1 LysR family transcriptional regulator [Clostridium tyrobutyricum]MBV4439937.1 LysR family transcriptional regulator [Clostridium tyrobutyricum]MBV4444982.1 LysR family transcriptional regulator [Clostridium tyrobutyricum]
MRLDQFYHIVEVAQSKSISLAAERSYMSQPAISSSISKLELELGVELFKRTNKGMIPTEIGKVVIEKASSIIDQIEDIKNVTRSSAAELTGGVSIAVEPSFCNTIMVNILTTFKYKHPKVNLMVKIGESNDVIHDVLSGKADISINLKTEQYMKSNDIIVKKLFKDNLMVIACKNSLLGNKNEIPIKEALEHPVALYNTGYETSCAVSQILKKYGNFEIAYRFDNLNVIEEVVGSGTCISFVPKMMFNYYKGSHSITTLLINDVNLEIEVIMVINKRHRISNIEKELINTIKSMCPRCEFSD